MRRLEILVFALVFAFPFLWCAPKVLRTIPSLNTWLDEGVWANYWFLWGDALRYQFYNAIGLEVVLLVACATVVFVVVSIWATWLILSGEYRHFGKKELVTSSRQAPDEYQW